MCEREYPERQGTRRRRRVSGEKVPTGRTPPNSMRARDGGGSSSSTSSRDRCLPLGLRDAFSTTGGRGYDDGRRDCDFQVHLYPIAKRRRFHGCSPPPPSCSPPAQPIFSASATPSSFASFHRTRTHTHTHNIILKTSTRAYHHLRRNKIYVLCLRCVNAFSLLFSYDIIIDTRS